MGCPPGQKKVAVVERWPLVQVRLYFQSHSWSPGVTSGHSWSLMSTFRPYQGGDILKI